MGGLLKSALFEEAGDDGGQVDIAVGIQEQGMDQFLPEAFSAISEADAEGAQFMTIGVFFEADHTDDPARVLGHPIGIFVHPFIVQAELLGQGDDLREIFLAGASDDHKPLLYHFLPKFDRAQRLCYM